MKKKIPKRGRLAVSKYQCAFNLEYWVTADRDKL